MGQDLSHSIGLALNFCSLPWSIAIMWWNREDHVFVVESYFTNGCSMILTSQCVFNNFLNADPLGPEQDPKSCLCIHLKWQYGVQLMVFWRKCDRSDSEFRPVCAHVIGIFPTIISPLLSEKWVSFIDIKVRTLFSIETCSTVSIINDLSYLYQKSITLYCTYLSTLTILICLLLLMNLKFGPRNIIEWPNT